MVETLSLLLIQLSLFCVTMCLITLLLEAIAELLPGFGGLYPFPSKWGEYWVRGVILSVVLFFIGAIGTLLV
jgi:hypothetical protein